MASSERDPRHTNGSSGVRSRSSSGAALDASTTELAAQHRKVPIYTIVMVCLATLFIYAETNVMAPNLTRIMKEFHMTEKERDEKLGGYISAAFFLIGMPVSLIVGFFADNINRPVVYSIVIALGEIPCFCSGFATNYEQLFWTRALSGISVGGAVPLTYSLLGDLFPVESRSIGAALVGVCMGGGILVGQMAGGLIGPHYGWRVPFFVVAVPALIMAVVVFFTVEDPPRGQQEQALTRAVASGESYHGSFTWTKFKNMLLVKTNILVFVTSAASTVPWGAISVFANDYLAVNKKLGSEKATWIVVLFAVGAAVGIFGGGLIGQMIYNERRRNITIYMTLTTLGGIIPMAFLFEFARNSLFGLCLFLGFLAGLLLSAASANFKAMILNVNLPEVRGSAFAVLNIADDLGKGIGPMIFAAMSSEIGRPWAMHVSIMLFIVTGLFTLFTYWTLEDDEDAAQRQVSEAQDQPDASDDDSSAAGGKRDGIGAGAGAGSEFGRVVAIDAATDPMGQHPSEDEYNGDGTSDKDSLLGRRSALRGRPGAVEDV